MSLQTRLALIYTAIFSVAFAAFGFVIFYLPLASLEASTDTELLEMATRVIAETEVFGSGEAVRFFVPEELSALGTGATYLVVTSASGDIREQSRNLNNFNEALDPEGFGDEQVINNVNQFGSRLRVLTIPLITDNRDIIGYLQVARRLDYYNQFITLAPTFLFIGGGAVTFSLLLSLIMTHNSLRPLTNMASLARQITDAQDLSLRVDDTVRKDEIGDMATAFNQTLGRLDQAFSNQKRFLADISHELRTPLTTIRGNMDLMQRYGEIDEETVIIIQDELMRMTRLVGDLMMLARADSGQLPIEKEDVDLDDIVLAVYEQFNSVERDVHVLMGDVVPVRIRGNQDRLKQLIINLVDNGIKYTPSGGNVTVSLRREGIMAELTIADTGLGIPAEDLPHIFNRFYRVDKARSRAQGGSGLGLSIVKWIVDMHDGRVNVTSTEGEGTTFHILLPGLVSETAVEAEELAERRSRLRNARQRIRFNLPRITGGGSSAQSIPEQIATQTNE